MPTNNSWNSQDPAQVAKGGTGIATTTAYAPICGGTTATGAMQAASTGLSTSGYVLTSNGASALPSFQAVPTISAAFKAGKLSSAQTITGGSQATVVFENATDNGGFNVGGAYNTGTYTFTAPATGYYIIITSVVVTPGNASDVVFIKVNSTQIANYNVGSTSAGSRCLSVVASLSTNDTVTVEYYAPSSNASIDNNAQNTYFCISQIK